MRRPYGQERHFWRAVESLRQAEALAGMVSKVSGPADAPPEPGQEKTWLDDWRARARGALRKAGELVQEGTRVQKERAQQIARRVRDSARSVWEALPTTKTARSVQSIADAANMFSLGTLIGGTGLTLLILYLGWKLLSKG